MTIGKTTLLILATILAAGTARANVQQDWATRFGTAGSSGAAVAVDPAGNVYVAANIFRGVRGFDLLTIKYDAAGTQLWSREFNGIGNGLEYPVGIAITSAGSIVVTGTSFRGPTALNYEIVTMAYAPNGDSLWLARYNGVSAKDDRPLALAVDASGNTYVAGYSNGNSVSSWDGRDYVTIKYGPTGAQSWAATYPLVWCSGANALAVDARGNVYVTGGGYDGNPTFGDYLTIKYSTLGAPLWVARYAGADDDEAKAIAVDGSGNVCVTGRGQQVSGYADITTIQYDSAGVERWVKRYDGVAHSDDGGLGIGIDMAHNIYVTGSETNANAFNNRDIVTLKYSTTGDSLWCKHYDGPSASYDDPLSIWVDGAGNSIVLGRSYGPGVTPFTSYYGFLTMGYGSGGDPLWLVRYDGPGDGDEYAGGLAVGVDGSIVVAGGSIDYLSGNGYVATVRYSGATLDVAAGPRPRPEPARLSWSHPNPCAQAATIQFRLASAAPVSLRVYDLQGREVAALADGVRPAGEHAVRWDASSAPDGVYFYRLRIGAREETRRMVVVR